MRQAALVLFDDIALKMPNRTRLFEIPEKRLAREIGAMALGRRPTPEQRTMEFLGESYDVWNDAHGDPDRFIKLRLSLLELLFREAEAMLRECAPKNDVASWWALLQKRTSPPKNAVEDALQATIGGIAELNDRFKEAGLPFEYHNGLIQRIDDEITTNEIERPFWALVSDPKYSNVDSDIKEALDRRDSGKPDAAFHALKAVESVLKILCDDLGRTRGTERGAADFVDNLVSLKLGRYIETWEADALKSLFRDIRNPLGHGSGNAQPLALSSEQTTWVVESAMSWIKSLLRRKP
ncbi:hypothetical protein MASR2M32_02830 [Sphaerotilus sulfidivorans]